jgi:hypothetical protein
VCAAALQEGAAVIYGQVQQSTHGSPGTFQFTSKYLQSYAVAMNWHRLFGLLLTDFFFDSPFVVELEKDLSLKKQLLDVVILRRGRGKFTEPLPDGLSSLAAHNLITFKSHHEVLDDWALKELTGHYVNYRKQVSPAEGPLLPESDFRLYAICSRYPHNLASEAAFEGLQDGVYDCRRGSDVIRVIVAGQLPRTEPNAMLHLFSAAPDPFEYGARHYRQRSADSSSLLRELVSSYRSEGFPMPYTMADFRRDYVLEHFPELTEEEQQKALQNLSPGARLKGLSPEERLKDLTPEERLKDLSPDEIESYLRKLRAERSAPKRKPRRKH